MGGPCCARILTTWFASKERGTYWGMWNIAHNLGGFAAPLVAGGFAKSMGWQWGMWAPGIIGLIVGVFVLFACRCAGAGAALVIAFAPPAPGMELLAGPTAAPPQSSGGGSTQTPLCRVGGWRG